MCSHHPMVTAVMAKDASTKTTMVLKGKGKKILETLGKKIKNVKLSDEKNKTIELN